MERAGIEGLPALGWRPLSLFAKWVCGSAIITHRCGRTKEAQGPLRFLMLAAILRYCCAYRSCLAAAANVLSVAALPDAHACLAKSVRSWLLAWETVARTAGIPADSPVGAEAASRRKRFVFDAAIGRCT